VGKLAFLSISIINPNTINIKHNVNRLGLTLITPISLMAVGIDWLKPKKKA
jgi:hypothetical protein